MQQSVVVRIPVHREPSSATSMCKAVTFPGMTVHVRRNTQLKSFGGGFGLQALGFPLIATLFKKPHQLSSRIFVGFLCSLITDPPVLSLEEATRALLSRWGASENTFKPLQERHPAHYQPGFKRVESERQEIANPDIKLLEKRIGRLRKALDKLYKSPTKTPQQTNKEGTVRGNCRHPCLRAYYDHDNEVVDL